MHRLSGGRSVLALDARYSGWAERERLDVAPAPTGDRDEPPGFITPRDGDEFLVEGGIPASSQTIPVRVRGGERARLVVDGRVVSLQDGRSGRLALLAGTHELELRSPGSSEPLQVIHVQVRGSFSAEPRK